jgi:hypothetical protein
MNENDSSETLALRDFISEALRNLHPRLQQFVCPILGADARGVPQLLGSGILLKVLSHWFLITAAHVLDENTYTNFYLLGKAVDLMMGKTALLDLEGTVHFVNTPEAGRKHDRLDLGFVALSDSLAAELATRYSFLSPEDLDVNEVLTMEVVVARAPYAFVGYPQSRNKARPGNKFKPCGAMFSLSPAPLERYSGLDLDSRTHIVANFDRSNIGGPEPYGISGGGVWYVGDHLILTGSQRPKLVAVAIEWREPEKVMVGVRISVAVSMIVAAYPDTKSLFPEPTQVDARVTFLDD